MALAIILLKVFGMIIGFRMTLARYFGSSANRQKLTQTIESKGDHNRKNESHILPFLILIIKKETKNQDDAPGNL